MRDHPSTPRERRPGRYYRARLARRGVPVRVWSPELGRYAWVTSRQYLAGMAAASIARGGRRPTLRRIAELAGYAGPSGSRAALRRLRSLSVWGVRSLRGRRGMTIVWKPRRRNVHTPNPSDSYRADDRAMQLRLGMTYGTERPPPRTWDEVRAELAEWRAT
jgi:hypothetical protein